MQLHAPIVIWIDLFEYICYIAFQLLIVRMLVLCIQCTCALTGGSPFVSQKCELLAFLLQASRENFIQGTTFSSFPLHTSPSTQSHPPPLTSQDPTNDHKSQLNPDVARWIEERDILLQTGVYSNTDTTIQKLDAKIRQALQQQTAAHE